MRNEGDRERGYVNALVVTNGLMRRILAHVAPTAAAACQYHAIAGGLLN